VTETPEPEYLVPRELGARVVIADPDAVWPEQYAAEEKTIRAALGAVLRRIEHAGSTSVPGLAAKPIVDILLTVEDPADETTYVQPLEGAGYTFHHREPHWHEHRLFKKGTPHFSPDRPDDQPRVNLHVFPDGCEEVRRMLVFRDWLRSNAADRRRYEGVKRTLAMQEWQVVQDYADAKSEVVAEIMERALQATNGDGSPAPTRMTSG
jgi:GrpB-like predicted nucleotidyltransferase (UPF0157 family)